MPTCQAMLSETMFFTSRASMRKLLGLEQALASHASTLCHLLSHVSQTVSLFGDFEN